jgi:ribosomal protein S27E
MGAPGPDIAQAKNFIASPGYSRHRPEATLLHPLVAGHYPRVKCDACQAERLVAFSRKRRGLCPSCGARRMVETAGLLVDSILPQQPVRQSVLSLPFASRYLPATRP